MLPFELTKDTPYLALSGELWSVFYEYFNRNWSCYKGFLLYVSVNYTFIGSDNGLLFDWCQAIYLNQCWDSVNWTLRNKF